MRKRKQRVNREHFPYVYVGPDTKYGLKSGTALKIIGRGRMGMRACTAPDGRTWQVPDAQVRKFEREATWRERRAVKRANS